MLHIRPEKFVVLNFNQGSDSSHVATFLNFQLSKLANIEIEMYLIWFHQSRKTQSACRGQKGQV